MKGLYVYGALSMALSFTVGMVAINGSLVAMSLVAVLSAAGSEAAAEIYRQTGSRLLTMPGNILAVMSWVFTAGAGIYAILLASRVYPSFFALSPF